MSKADDCLMIGSYDCGLNSELFLHTYINQLFFCLRQESVHVCEPQTGLYNRDFTIYMSVYMLVCWYVGMLVCWYVGMLVCWFVYKKYVCQNA